MSKKQKSNDELYDLLDDSFSEFISKLSKLGKIATSELSHSNFTSDDKDNVITAISEYDAFLKEVNNKLDIVKKHTSNLYNIDINK